MNLVVRRNCDQCHSPLGRELCLRSPGSQSRGSPRAASVPRVAWRCWSLGFTLAITCLGDDRVSNSKHDLSTSGPGPIRAAQESQVCIFCHTPHNASPAAPLWNRSNPRTHYRIYRSSTTDARVDQPGAASKLCLSCHDGSIALGMVISRDTPIPTSHTFIPTGATNLTNDLSDDHPVGLRYDRVLARRDGQLRDPQVIDHRIQLGPRGELECTACHDPHNNELGDFLRLPARDGTLCTTCHQMRGWQTGAHALSRRPVPRSASSGGGTFATVGEQACGACHVSHGAGQRARLLRERSYDLCLGCHDGVTAQEVSSVVGQRSGHKPSRALERHDADEDPRSMPAHVDCVDCHNPHAVRSDPLATSDRSPRGRLAGWKPALEEMPGVSIGGGTVDRATHEYEVCFRCHADNPVLIRDRIVRQRDDLGNIRRQFAPATASAHPVAFPARGLPETPSLIGTLRSGATLSCQDCHDNPDARRFGGGGPNGPHGSRFPHLLVARYETADQTAESPEAYALCYRCHDRSSILADESFAFHRVHVERGRSPCSACHAAHGVNGSPRQHSHLINFDLAIVGGQRRFEDEGRFAGSCTLTCHGVNHVNFRYSR